MGQIKIALDEAFFDYDLLHEETEHLEKQVRSVLFPEKPSLKSDGHDGYTDQYGCSYDELGMRNTEATYEEKCRMKRPPSFSGYFGIANEKTKDGALAFEIYSTIRQYISLKNNDGYSGIGVNFDDPHEITKIPLPKIHDFTTEKKFTIRGRSIVEKIAKAEEAKDYKTVWDIINDYVKRHHPELAGYSSATISKEGSSYSLNVKGARKNETN